VYRLNPLDAQRATVGEDDVVELDTGRAAPLRGWARLDTKVEPGSVALDARGLAILKAAAGEKVTLRRVLAGPTAAVAFGDSSA
jgi:N-methylhydantoinase B